MADAARATALFRRFDAAELKWCRTFNRFGQRPLVQPFFRLVSRLGDGVLWYTVMLCLPLANGSAGVTAAVHMLLSAAVGTLIYKLLKHRLVRRRPFVAYTRVIHCGIAPLDEFSFPSGHTLHAACFTALAFFYFPALGLALLPFALLVACSRVVLGLHYPTDVLVGAALGLSIAGAGIVLVPGAGGL